MKPEYFEVDWNLPLDMNWTLEYLVEETEVTVDIGVAVGSFILSACVVLFNGLLLLSVLLHCTKTKVTTIKLLIINSAAADLLQGALINPFHGYQAFSEWKLSRMWCEAWSTLEPTIFVISTLSLLSVNIDRLIYVTNPEKHSKCLQIKLTALLIAIPWVLGSLIIPPLYVLGEDTSFLKPPKAPLCVLIPKQPVIRTIFTLCSIIGTAILIIFLVIFCMVFRSPGIRSYGLVKDTDSTSIRNKILALCTVNSFFFLLRFPWIYSPHVIHVVCENMVCDKHKLDIAHAVLMWISHCGFSVNPFAWMVDRDVRAAYLDLFLCKACLPRNTTNRCDQLRPTRSCKNDSMAISTCRYTQSVLLNIENSPSSSNGEGIDVDQLKEVYEMTN